MSIRPAIHISRWHAAMPAGVWRERIHDSLPFGADVLAQSKILHIYIQ